ncbi:MAG: hypothetical protein CVU90_08915 [Firmicutes bacterium HGW-Firmicutes-15]|nr:MAG: hypothetical protein CVU90_08915 [Firmicutes bacterium HGW-Firmicutes-15]
MKNRWGKGDPVNLSDLLKITPVANEILHLSEELGMNLTEVMWIVSQIVENSDEIPGPNGSKLTDDESQEDEWDEMDLESMEEEMDQAMYLVNVKINGMGRFPEIGFKAGVNDKEDMHYFFDMVLEMIDKLD